ncbi:MAG: lysostaphin resistance A-like protein [Thermacetogeniaceae bacterium]
MEEKERLEFPRQRTPWGMKELVGVLVFASLGGAVSAPLFSRLLERIPWLAKGVPGEEALRILTAGYVQSFLLFALVLFCVLFKYRAPIAAVGLNPLSIKEVFSMGFVGFAGGLAALAVVLLLMSAITSLVHKTPPPQPLAELLVANGDRGFLLLSAILVGILSPVGEEVYFRGFVYPAIRWRLGMLPALLLSSLLFGALHFDIFRLLPLTAGGAILALICETTSSLIPSILAHSVWNIGMLLLLVS